jgi:hypothetical protein
VKDINWRVIVAVVVAFVVGIGAGGIAEHQRLKNKSNKSASASKSKTKTTTKATTKTTAKPVTTADWFGTHGAQACPALKRVDAAGTAAFKAIYSSAPLDSRRTILAASAGTIGTAYTSLVPLANAPGKPMLQFLANYQGRLKTAAQAAPSLTAYLTAQKALDSPQLKQSAAPLNLAHTRCGG